jgi:hypothetical protein
MMSVTKMPNLHFLYIIVFEMTMFILKFITYGMISAFILGVCSVFNDKLELYTEVGVLSVFVFVTFAERSVTYNLHYLIKDIYDLDY